MRTAIGACEASDQIHNVEGVESLRLARSVPSVLKHINEIPVMDSFLLRRDDREGRDDGRVALA